MVCGFKCGPEGGPSSNKPSSRGSVMQITCIWGAGACYLFSLLEGGIKVPAVRYKFIAAHHALLVAKWQPYFLRGEWNFQTNADRDYHLYLGLRGLTHMLTFVVLCGVESEYLYHVEVLRSFFFLLPLFLFSLVLRNVSMYTSQSTSLWKEPN